MRIIAGTYRSRVLKSARGMKLRPTSGRLRETLFSILGPLVTGTHFVDLYAGTGAVGIEALSRGAADAIFIEKHAPAAALIRRNLESLGITQGTTVLVADALRGLQMLGARNASDVGYTADIVFLDPPWSAEEEYACSLGFLGSANFLAPAALVIVEHRRGLTLPKRFGWLRWVRLLRQGDAALSFFQPVEPSP